MWTKSTMVDYMNNLYLKDELKSLPYEINKTDLTPFEGMSKKEQEEYVINNVSYTDLLSVMFYDVLHMPIDFNIYDTLDKTTTDLLVIIANILIMGQDDKLSYEEKLKRNNKHSSDFIMWRYLLPMLADKNLIIHDKDKKEIKTTRSGDMLKFIIIEYLIAERLPFRRL